MFVSNVVLTHGPFLPAVSQVWHTLSIVVLRGSHTVSISLGVCNLSD